MQTFLQFGDIHSYNITRTFEMFLHLIVPVAVVYTNDKCGIVKVNGMDG